MPHIDSTEFGSVVIDKKKYSQVLIVGEKIIERDYEKLKKMFDTAHKIGDWEIAELISNNPEIIVIGIGQNGAMAAPRQSDFQNRGGGKRKNIELIIAETPKAIKIYNDQVKLGKKVNALIHTTC